jgi:diguanylate cyclase (GGDEF)-like protein
MALPPASARMRSPLALVAGVVTVSLAFLVLLWAQPWGAHVSTLTDDFTEVVVMGLATGACWLRAVRSEGRSHRTWFLLATYAGLWLLASVIWAWYEYTGRTLPSPSVADIPFLMAVPVGAAALLCFPSAVTATSRMRMLLDGTVISASVLFVSWAVLLGPLVRMSSSPSLALVVSIAYPVGDVIVLSLAINMLARAGRNRTTVLVLTAGIAAITVSDSAYAWISTVHPASGGELTGAGWVLGFLLIAVAAVSATSNTQDAAAAQSARPASPLVIYGSVLASVGVAAVELTRGHGLDVVLSWIEIAIWLLVVIRQWLSSLEVAERQEELHTLAFHDVLTGLPNRAMLADRLRASFTPGSERRERHESVLFIDIDDFKDVNDSLGHEGGDALLVQLTDRLKTCVRPYDLIARLGGDEFAIVVVEGEGSATAVAVAERILESLRAPFLVNGTGLNVAVSIGIAPRNAETTDAAELLRQADFAMYMAKGGGKGRYQLFDAHMHNSMVGGVALKAALAAAVPAGQLRLDYQPIADLRTGQIVGAEALVRWQHPTLGLLQPVEFISLAEETGDIEAIGCWVLETATRQAAAWRRNVKHFADLWVSVNISPLQLDNARSQAAILQILTDPAVEADKLVLEVTETALTAHGGIASLVELRRHGVRIAIDDFGTGFSSLSRLAGFPVDILKIDRSFVSGGGSSPPSVPMLEAILGMAEKLSLDVIAEGIEQGHQLDLLCTLGCRLGQGFLLSHPIAPSALEALLASGGQVEIRLPAVR